MHNISLSLLWARPIKITYPSHSFNRKCKIVHFSIIWMLKIVPSAQLSSLRKGRWPLWKWKTTFDKRKMTLNKIKTTLEKRKMTFTTKNQSISVDRLTLPQTFWQTGSSFQLPHWGRQPSLFLLGKNADLK